MSTPYAIDDTSTIFSPALVVFREIVERNIKQMIAVAGSPDRLRPHCKTHKMPAVARLELEMGIRKHKCATLAEAEMLAEVGVQDIFIAYNLVGPNIARAVQFTQKWPQVQLAVGGDHRAPLKALGAAMAAAGTSIEVVLDVDVGQGRTGIRPGNEAQALYALVVETPGLRPGGIHAYDGHNHQTDLDERRAAVDAAWAQAVHVKDRLIAAGLPVPRIIAGGTGSCFPTFLTRAP